MGSDENVTYINTNVCIILAQMYVFEYQLLSLDVKVKNQNAKNEVIFYFSFSGKSERKRHMFCQYVKNTFSDILIQFIL